MQLRQEESTASELRVPLSTFLIFHSSYSHPPAPLRTAHAVFSSRGREERRGEWWTGSPQSERAERRYLKRMQRVQLCSGSPLLGKRGKKSRTMAACVRLPGIRLTTIYATSATTTVHLLLLFHLLFLSRSHPSLSPRSLRSLRSARVFPRPALERRAFFRRENVRFRKVLVPRVSG